MLKMQSDNDFKDWPVIGKGTERVCLQNPNNPEQCIKLSKKTSAKQTYREIDFFEKLQKKNIQFTHIPEYLGEVSTETQVGFKQQVILDESMTVSSNMAEYILQQGQNLNIDSLLSSILTLKDYLICNRIPPSDLGFANLLVKQTKNGITIYLIDGFGNTEFIPVSNFIPNLMTAKIKRKFKKFIIEKLNPFLAKERSNQDIEIYNNKISDFIKLHL